MSRPLRVASYNVHGCLGRDGRRDVARIVHILREIDADVSGCRRSIAPRPERDRSGREPRRGARHGVHRRSSAAPRQARLVRQRPAHPARGAGGAARAVRQLRRRGAGRHPVRSARGRRHALARDDHPPRPALAPPPAPVRDAARPAGAEPARADRAPGRFQRVVVAQPRADRIAPPRRAAAFTPDLSGLASGAQAGPHRVLGLPAARRGAPPVHPAHAARIRPSADLRRSARGCRDDRCR